MKTIYEQREDVLELYGKKDMVALQHYLADLNPIDIADLLDPLDSATTLVLFRMLPKDIAVDVFAKFSREQQQSIIEASTDEEAESIVTDLFFDDMIDLIEEVPANIVNKILKYANKDERGLVNQFLNYKPESAGALMTIEYVTMTRDMTVREALAHLKEVGLASELIYTIYVVNEKRKLEGYVSLRKIVTAESDTITIDEIMEEDVIVVHADDDQEDVAGVFRRYGFVALPVVDKEERMLGIITVDDIMEVMELEVTEDFHLIAGSSPSEKPYLETSVMEMVKHRLPWLLVLMISGTFTGRIMGRYEALLAQQAVLGTMVPMLMDTGGNSGSQSSTLIIRDLAVGELTDHDGLKIVAKEFAVSFLVGTLLAAVNYVRLIMLEKVDPIIALTVSLTLVATVMMAKIVGGLLPIAAEKIGSDPAIMAGPLITTIVDAMALLLYFQIASSLLGF